MKRDTISGASHKAQMGSSSRGTMRKMDHSTVIPTADMDVTHGETSKGVPVVQPYGFSYWPMEQSEEQGQGGGGSGGGGSGGGSGGGGGGSQQPQGKSAMGLTSYANGSRSDPSSQNLQDPRHHMMLEDEKQQGGQQGGGSGGGGGSSSSSQQESKGGKAGDVALYRTAEKDNLQQFHLTNEGPRLTSVKTMKFALVEAEQDQQGGSQGSSGGGGSGGNSQSGQSSKSDGQRPIFKKESKKYIEQTTDKTTAAQGDGHTVIEDKKVRMRYKDDEISCLVTDKHVHIRFKANRIWVDEDGCFSTKPIQVKPDPYDAS